MKLYMRFCLLVLASSLLMACTTLKHTGFSDESGAIRGYDPVAYFTQGEPVKGNPEFSHEYLDVTWHFSSQEHFDLFQANPEKYAPQYGGYCAYAMSKGFVVSIDPQAWRIHNEKLYLNYSLGVRNTWSKKPDVYVQKADQHWENKTAM